MSKAIWEAWAMTVDPRPHRTWTWYRVFLVDGPPSSSERPTEVIFGLPVGSPINEAVSTARRLIRRYAWRHAILERLDERRIGDRSAPEHSRILREWKSDGADPRAVMEVQQ